MAELKAGNFVRLFQTNKWYQIKEVGDGNEIIYYYYNTKGKLYTSRAYFDGRHMEIEELETISRNNNHSLLIITSEGELRNESLPDYNALDTLKNWLT